MAIDLTQTPNEVKSIIEGWMDNKTSNIHTSIPGAIVSYNAKTNRASVQPNGNYKAEDGRNIPYPIIHNVPIQFPIGLGGNAGITFPISAGDGCLLVFSETQNDDFLSNNKSDSPDVRKHSLNDAIAIPGVYAGAAPSNVSHSSDVCLFNGGAMLRLNGNEFSGSVGGTTFSFSGGDLAVNGISLVHHKHGGVMTGGGKTGEPE